MYSSHRAEKKFYTDADDDADIDANGISPKNNMSPPLPHHSLVAGNIKKLLESTNLEIPKKYPEHVFFERNEKYSTLLGENRRTYQEL